MARGRGSYTFITVTDPNLVQGTRVHWCHFPKARQGQGSDSQREPPGDIPLMDPATYGNICKCCFGKKGVKKCKSKNLNPTGIPGGYGSHQ